MLLALELKNSMVSTWTVPRVCLGIMPHVIFALEWNVLQVSLHTDDQICAAYATIPENKPQQFSSLSVQAVLLWCPHSYCPHKVTFCKTYPLDFYWSSIRCCSLSFLWSACGEICPAVCFVYFNKFYFGTIDV